MIKSNTLKTLNKAIFLLMTTLILSNFTYAEDARIIDIPEEGFQIRIDMIQQAKETIDIEYYSIWENHQSTRMIMSLLNEAANRGVKVRIIIDEGPGVMGDGNIGYLLENPNIELNIIILVSGDILES